MAAAPRLVNAVCRGAPPFRTRRAYTMMSEPAPRSGIIPEVIVSKTETPTITIERMAALDWRRVAAALDAHGCAVVTSLVTPEACRALAAGYEVEDAFRSRVVMARHGFGSGEYKYFAYPLP